MRAVNCKWMDASARLDADLTMRLSDVGLRRHPTKLIYPHHRPSTWLTEDATPRSLEPIVRPHGVLLPNVARFFFE